MPQGPREHTSLVNDAVTFLLTQGIPAWKNQSGMIPTMNHRTGKRYLIRLGVKGGSDVIACLPPNGQLLALEIKQGKDKLRPEQQKFLDAIRKVGGKTLVIRSLEELEDFIL